MLPGRPDQPPWPAPGSPALDTDGAARPPTPSGPGSTPNAGLSVTIGRSGNPSGNSAPPDPTSRSGRHVDRLVGDGHHTGFDTGARLSEESPPRWTPTIEPGGIRLGNGTGAATASRGGPRVETPVGGRSGSPLAVSAGRSGADEPFVIELFEDGSPEGDEQEIGFGVRQSRREQRRGGGGDGATGHSADTDERGRRRRGLVIGGVTVACLAAAGLVGATRDTGNDQASTAPSTTAGQPASTTRPDPAITGDDLVVPTLDEPPPAVTDEPTTTEPEPIVLDLGGLDTGGEPISLFISSGMNRRTVTRIDLTTGAVLPWEDPAGQELMVLPSAEGPVLVDSSFAAEAWSAVPGEPGTVWLVNQMRGAIEQYDLISKEVVRSYQAGSGWFGSQLIGSMADRRPVIIGPDFRPYALNPDDTLTRVNEATVYSVQPGGQVQMTCAENMICPIQLSTASGIVDIGPIDLSQSLVGSRFTPDGSRALLTRGGEASIVDFTTGTITPVTIDGTPTTVSEASFGWFGSGDVGQSWFGAGNRYVAFITPGDDLVIYDAVTANARRILLPTDFTAVRILGVA